MTSTLTPPALTPPAVVPQRTAAPNAGRPAPIRERTSDERSRNAFVPGAAAHCTGEVFHRRRGPVDHAFSRPVSYAWIDPDRPGDLTDAHPCWSARWPAPARFRRRDYGATPNGSLSDAARSDLALVLGHRPTGQVRMLTQLRRWGWLFNPITVYVVWGDRGDAPVGAVLEVTNTPWKERIRYPIALRLEDGWWRARTAKSMHVSPFLDEDHEYEVRLRRRGDRIDLDVDVVPPGADMAVLSTGVRLEQYVPSRRVLGAALRDPSTHRVSFGIHTEAFRLWWKRVPFVPHPSKRDRDANETAVGRGPMTVSETAVSAAGAGRAVAGGVTSAPLMAHADRGRPTLSGVGRRVGAGIARLVLRTTRHERLTVHDSTGTTTYGSRDRHVEVDAEVTVHDSRALAAMVREGSIGVGRGYVEGWWSADDPVDVVRFAIRNVRGLDRLRNSIQRCVGWVSDPLRRALPHDTRDRNRDDIGAHYDIGNDFFEIFLDETMTYSSAVFPTPETSLADASRHKYDRLLDQLGVGAGDHLLEIGTGWGGMAIRAAERGARVTTTTISAEQHTEARRRVAAAGLDHRVDVLDRDWRDLEGSFDHVVSIEMIEAVDWRDYDAFFSTIERSLRPGGRAAIQAICLPDDRWERAKNTEDFIRRFVFPNGYLPSVAAIRDSVRRSTSRRLVGVDDITPHYAETLRRWRSTFDGRIDEVERLGLDERFQRLWRFYLAYCEAGFRERHVHVHQLLIA